MCCVGLSIGAVSPLMGSLCAMLVEGLSHVSIGAKQDKVLVAQ